MTWASASGGGGEKIGEVRMFVGRDNIPAGWEEVGLSVPDTFDNVWSVAPSYMSSGYLLSGDNSDLAISLYSRPSQAVASATGKSVVVTHGSVSGYAAVQFHSLDISSGVTSASVQTAPGARANISAQLQSGDAFFAGGYFSSNSTFTPTSRSVDANLVITALAPCPIASAVGCGGFISEDELAFFSSGTGSAASVLSLESYAYSVSGNSWRKLADAPRDMRGCAVIPTTGGAFLIGAVNAVASRKVLRYDIALDSYEELDWVWPSGVTGVRAVDATRLPSGKHLILCRLVEIGNSGAHSSANKPRLFVVGDSGPEYEVTPPTQIFSNYATLCPSDPGHAPCVLFRRLGAQTSSEANLAYDGAYFFDENSFEFLSKSAIVYARKLP